MEAAEPGWGARLTGAAGSPLRVLVVGARGFVGAALTLELLRRGHAVSALDVRGDPGPLAAVTDDIDWYVGDGSTLEAVLGAVDRRPVDAIYYGPFYRGGTEPSLAREIDVMAAGAWRVFDLARALALQRIVFPSSTAVHGYQRGADVVDEESPVLPVGVYGAAKLMSERVAMQVNASIGSNVVTALRLPSIYGPGASIASRRVNVPAVQAARGRPATVEYGAGARVCLSHVEDTGAMLADTIEAATLRHTVYELGGLDVSFGDIAASVRALVPAAQIGFGDGTDVFLPHAVSNARGAHELGFTHRGLAAGMKSIIDYERDRMSAPAHR